MNEPARILSYPITSGGHGTDAERHLFGRVVRAGIFTGVLMVAPNKPSGWEWNPAVITLLLVLASLIAGGAWYLGYQAAVIDGIKQDAAESKRAAQTAQAVASGGIVEEEATPTPTPKRR